MNVQEHLAAPAPAPLPELTEERIDAIESALFADISRERATGRARRTRWWIGGAAAAAVIIVAAVVAPSVGGLLAGGAAGSNESAVAPDAPATAPGPATGAGSDMSTGGTAVQGGGKGSAGGADSSGGQRDIATTATATLIVTGVAAAAERVGAAAEAHGGYTESMSIGQAGTALPSGAATPIEPNTGTASDSSSPYPAVADGGWITVRVPADSLDTVMHELAPLGEVTASSIDRQDVTDQTVDLEAQVKASQASVDRLTELMRQAKSVTDLLAAESALADRQATLESDQAQLKSLRSTVEMSSLSVTLQPKAEAVAADPAGFTDGLAAGWNGLVATLNGVVVAFGFLIPWLVVVVIVGLIVWAIVRVTRRRSTRAAAAAQQHGPEDSTTDPSA